MGTINSVRACGGCVPNRMLRLWRAARASPRWCYEAVEYLEATPADASQDACSSLGSAQQLGAAFPYLEME